MPLCKLVSVTISFIYLNSFSSKTAEEVIPFIIALSLVISATFSNLFESPLPNIENSIGRWLTPFCLPVNFIEFQVFDSPRSIIISKGLSEDK